METESFHETADLKPLKDELKTVGAENSEGFMNLSFAGETAMRRALHVGQDGDQSILMHPDGRLLRYRITQGGIVLHWDHYEALDANERPERDEDYATFGVRAASILKDRAKIARKRSQSE